MRDTLARRMGSGATESPPLCLAAYLSGILDDVTRLSEWESPTAPPMDLKYKFHTYT